VRLFRRAWVEIRHAAETVGYWLRPYDMLADRRRWFWQPAQRCGGVVLLNDEDLSDRLKARMRLLDGLDRRAEGSDR
jgi:hypothetical protein